MDEDVLLSAAMLLAICITTPLGLGCLCQTLGTIRWQRWHRVAALSGGLSLILPASHFSGVLASVTFWQQWSAKLSQ